MWKSIMSFLMVLTFIALGLLTIVMSHLATNQQIIEGTTHPGNEIIQSPEHR